MASRRYARCNFGGGELHPGDRAAIEAFGQFLTTRRGDPVPETGCGCCLLDDYDPAPEGGDDVPGSCLNCGHSPEEHE